MARLKDKAALAAPRRGTAAGAFAAGLVMLQAGGGASAQGLTVLPVNIELAAGQMATSLTVINHGGSETSVQVRAFDWKQPNGAEQLTPSDVVLVSPPIATIPAGGTQVVRLLLRHPGAGERGDLPGSVRPDPARGSTGDGARRIAPVHPGVCRAGNPRAFPHAVPRPE